ncbi:unnamed protein product [Ambrosiozyma monospora]|uniref:Unnamed protein product n=1 Tax=Ambrosiozyma monospora TaxID=43982 RepID=A0ACB5U1A8_AMBMO|nr:unnamed protein product [Ambrosiozyma monospora]
MIDGNLLKSTTPIPNPSIPKNTESGRNEIGTGMGIERNLNIDEKHIINNTTYTPISNRIQQELQTRSQRRKPLLQYIFITLMFMTLLITPLFMTTCSHRGRPLVHRFLCTQDHPQPIELDTTALLLNTASASAPDEHATDNTNNNEVVGSKHEEDLSADEFNRRLSSIISNIKEGSHDAIVPRFKFVKRADGDPTNSTTTSSSSDGNSFSSTTSTSFSLPESSSSESSSSSSSDPFTNPRTTTTRSSSTTSSSSSFEESSSSTEPSSTEPSTTSFSFSTSSESSSQPETSSSSEQQPTSSSSFEFTDSSSSQEETSSSSSSGGGRTTSFDTITSSSSSESFSQETSSSSSEESSFILIF